MRSPKVALCLALAVAGGVMVVALTSSSPVSVRLVSAQRVSGPEPANQDRLLVSLLITNLSRGPVALKNMHVDLSQQQGWKPADDSVRTGAPYTPFFGLDQRGCRIFTLEISPSIKACRLRFDVGCPSFAWRIPEFLNDHVALGKLPRVRLWLMQVAAKIPGRLIHISPELKIIGAPTSGSRGAHVPPTNDFALTLRYGNEVVLNQEAAQRLYSKAVELLESSNFNSSAPLWEWNVSEILEGYRKAVSGKHLLVSFEGPQAITTIGGEVSVRKIVIGLNRPDYGCTLYTVNDRVGIIGYTQHSALLGNELFDLVRKVGGED